MKIQEVKDGKKKWRENTRVKRKARLIKEECGSEGQDVKTQAENKSLMSCFWVLMLCALASVGFVPTLSGMGCQPNVVKALDASESGLSKRGMHDPPSYNIWALTTFYL